MVQGKDIDGSMVHVNHAVEDGHLWDNGSRELWLKGPTSLSHGSSELWGCKSLEKGSVPKCFFNVTYTYRMYSSSAIPGVVETIASLSRYERYRHF